MPFPLAEILSGLAADLPSVRETEVKEEITCPGCGLTFGAFTRQGRFGCGECYKAFRPRLEPIMRKIHGASMHRGKTPTVEAIEGESPVAVSVREEERLEQELHKAIESEDFERAAEIRDKLRVLRESLSVNK
jgi:protein arginine kinase activator